MKASSINHQASGKLQAPRFNRPRSGSLDACGFPVLGVWGMKLGLESRPDAREALRLSEAGLYGCDNCYRPEQAGLLEG